MTLTVSMLFILAPFDNKNSTTLERLHSPALYKGVLPSYNKTCKLIINTHTPATL